jgi:hypothetical protein
MAFLAVVLLPSGGLVSFAQSTSQPHEQQREAQRRLEQQRRLAVSQRRVLEEGERRIADIQANDVRVLQERADEQWRAEAEAARRRETEESEEWLAVEQQREETVLQRQDQQNQEPGLSQMAISFPHVALAAQIKRGSRFGPCQMFLVKLRPIESTARHDGGFE